MFNPSGFIQFDGTKYDMEWLFPDSTWNDGHDFDDSTDQRNCFIGRVVETRYLGETFGQIRIESKI